MGKQKKTADKKQSFHDAAYAQLVVIAGRLEKILEILDIASVPQQHRGREFEAEQRKMVEEQTSIYVYETYEKQHGSCPMPLRLDILNALLEWACVERWDEAKRWDEGTLRTELKQLGLPVIRGKVKEMAEWLSTTKEEKEAEAEEDKLKP